MTKTPDFNINPFKSAAADMLDLHEADGNFSMPTIVWLLVRSVTTGKAVGGIIMYDEGRNEARKRLSQMLDVAVAGGWRGMELLEALMAKGESSDRLEALARKAGTYCDNRPELLGALFSEWFGADAEECFGFHPRTNPQPEILTPVTPAVTLRRPMEEHFKLVIMDNGEEEHVMTHEAVLFISAVHGYDPAEAKDCGDGGAAARKMVTGVFKSSSEVGYSRMDALRVMLCQESHGIDTMAAIEHLTGECGSNVIVRGMRDAGFNLWGNDVQQ